MNELIIAWAGFALMVVLCFPSTGTRKFVLEIAGWVLRLSLLAILAGGAYLWFRPDRLPDLVTRMVVASPLLQEILPTPGNRLFGLAAVALAVVPLLPLLAAIDVTRKLAGWRLRRLRQMIAETNRPPVVAAEVVTVAPVVEPRPGNLPTAEPVFQRPGRRASAETLSEIAARQPIHKADHSS